MKKQYWMKLKYEHDGVERWELTQGRFSKAEDVFKAYEARGKSLNFIILETKPHEQFEPTK